MSEPRDILNRGLEILDREMVRLDEASKEEDESGKPKGLLAAQRDDLCAYMNVLHKLIGKDLGGEENFAEMTEEELKELAREYAGPAEQKHNRNKRRRGKAKANAGV